MKEREAIDKLKYHLAMVTFNPMTGEETPLWLLSEDEQGLYNACEIAIKALEEIQEYREIGTVDDFQRLDYQRSRYEDETYDFCGEYGTSECNLKDRVEKLQEYEAIGTVEECQEAVGKQEPKKHEYYGGSEDGRILCPTCKEDLWDLKECGFNTCPYCGQAIDWSEKNGKRI